jgi:hypothetical protein
MKTQTPDEPTNQVPLSTPPYTTADYGPAGYLYAPGFHELSIDRSETGDIVFIFPSEVHHAAADYLSNKPIGCRDMFIGLRRAKGLIQETIRGRYNHERDLHSQRRGR